MEVLLLLVAGLLLGILMTMAGERNMHSQPPHLPPGGNQYIGPQHDFGYGQYPYSPHYGHYRRQQSQNFSGMLLTIVFAIGLILLFLYG